MRIAFLVNSMLPKGPVFVSRDIVRGLVDRGYDVVVFYLKESHGVDFPCVIRHLGWRDLARLRSFDVVHSHSLRPDLLAWVLKNIFRHRARFVTTIHNYVENDLSMSYGKLVSMLVSPLWRLLWKGLDVAAALTKDAQGYYLRTLPRVSTVVVHNARASHDGGEVDADDRALLEQLHAAYTVVGANAAALKVKGLHQVIAALPALPNHAFVLVGDGPELSVLKRQAADLGVSSRFLALGFRGNARDYLGYYDIYVMPSLSEGMPLAMLEAVSANVPVVCSRIPVFQELFTPDEVGLFSLGSSQEMVAALSEDREILRARAIRAKDRVARQYTVDAMVDAYLCLYAQN